MGLTSAYEILSGAGTLYIAPHEEAAPTVDATPAGNWEEMGETDGGVKVKYSQEIGKQHTDQRTGAVKAIRKEESLVIETNLAQATLENLAQAMGGLTVTDTAAGSGTIGKREMGMSQGGEVSEFSMLFRADSPYGDYPAQYYVGRGFFSGEQGMEYKKEDKVLIPVVFEALEDLDAAQADRFGTYTAQDADAL